jgi:hypothetical protein
MTDHDRPEWGELKDWLVRVQRKKWEQQPPAAPEQSSDDKAKPDQRQ